MFVVPWLRWRSRAAAHGERASQVGCKKCGTLSVEENRHTILSPRHLSMDGSTVLWKMGAGMSAPRSSVISTERKTAVIALP